jgi:uncharacterized protein (TIGR02284 family)
MQPQGATVASGHREEDDAMTDRSEHAVLNHLIETCRDGERGFRLAADKAGDPSLKRLFGELASQRATFATELLPHAQRLGGDPPAEGTGMAALHRGWIAIEQTVRHDDRLIVSEVERGDRATLRIYFDAVNGMLPPETRDLVQRQLDELEETHARLPIHAGR